MHCKCVSDNSTPEHADRKQLEDTYDGEHRNQLFPYTMRINLPGHSMGFRHLQEEKSFPVNPRDASRESQIAG